MPFKSKAQRKYMYANKPEMAAEWETETPRNAKLPERKSRSTKSKEKNSKKTKK